MTAPCLLFDSSTKEKTWMVVDKNVTAAPAGLDNARAGSGEVYELSLYDELVYFAELPPEKQRRLVAHPETRSAQTAVQPSTEPVRNPVGLVEEETAESDSEALHDFEALNAPSELPPESIEGLSPSGPLPGVSLTPDPGVSGAPSRSVCLTCGAESAADDLFCASCGGFTDEIAPAVPISPKCGECGLGVAADEIFCPSCGALLSAQ
jgi:hypothetical protein